MTKRLIITVLTVFLAASVAFMAVPAYFPTAPDGLAVRQVDDTARLTWPTYQGAYHYVVTLQFKKTSGDAWTVDDTSMTTPPLRPNTQYTVCVTAVADTNSERECVDFTTL